MPTTAKFNSVEPNNNIKELLDMTMVSRIYCEAHNTSGDLENAFTCNDIDLSLNSLTFGSTAVVRVHPSLKLVNCLFLTATVQVPAGTEAFAYVPGVLYNAIDQIAFRVPGCERIIMEGYNLMPRLMDECENNEKRHELIRLAGLASVDGPFVNTTRTYYALIPLPFSQILCEGSNGAKPYPSHMTTEPLDVEIKWKVANTAFPTGSIINSATLIPYYTNLGSASAYKMKMYKYPMPLPYDYTYPVPVGNATERTVVLSGFRNGECSQLRIMLTAGQHNWLGYKMKDLTLRYAGEVIWKAPEEMQAMYELKHNFLNSRWSNANYDTGARAFAVNNAGSVPTSYSAWVVPTGDYYATHWYHIPISSILDHVRGIHNYAIGADFNLSELRLTWKDGINISTTDYLLRVQVSINSFFQFNGDIAAIIQ